MKVIYNSYSKLSRTAVAIGNFDGVHVGHRHLLDVMLKISALEKLTPSILTFHPHPEKYYNLNVPEISTQEQKNKIFEQMGVEICYYAEFNSEFAELTPDKFFEKYIINILDAKAIIVGDDFYFGKNRSGSSVILKELSISHGIYCDIIPKLKIDGAAVSSTRIRRALKIGDFYEAAKLLGRDYSCAGTVAHGDEVGRKIGFPTANLILENELILSDGVYFGYLYFNDKYYKCMIYIGSRPTVTYAESRRFEVHILDFNAIIYGERIEVFFAGKIRDSIKFDSIDELKRQLVADRQNVASLEFRPYLLK